MDSTVPIEIMSLSLKKTHINTHKRQQQNKNSNNIYPLFTPQVEMLSGNCSE